jgi:hypothetical protein
VLDAPEPVSLAKRYPSPAEWRYRMLAASVADMHASNEWPSPAWDTPERVTLMRASARWRRRVAARWARAATVLRAAGESELAVWGAESVATAWRYHADNTEGEADRMMGRVAIRVAQLRQALRERYALAERVGYVLPVVAAVAPPAGPTHPEVPGESGSGPYGLVSNLFADDAATLTAVWDGLARQVGTPYEPPAFERLGRVLYPLPSRKRDRVDEHGSVVDDGEERVTWDAWKGDDMQMTQTVSDVRRDGNAWTWTVTASDPETGSKSVRYFKTDSHGDGMQWRFPHDAGWHDARGTIQWSLAGLTDAQARAKIERAFP